MKPLLFFMPEARISGARLHRALACESGELEWRQFPDNETYLRYMVPVTHRDVVIVCALDAPDQKILGVYFAACVARELGARSVGLVIPYLPYMRQDRRFKEGEGITSVHFAKLLSSCCDWFVTVDPHLHRYHDLSELYSVPAKVVHAGPLIAQWIRGHVPHAVLVGPDAESEQWVASIASDIDCPYTVLQKRRSGDREVEVSIPDMSKWADRRPVVIDDIAATARTMIAAVKRMKEAKMAAPVCIAVHPLFADDAYAALQVAGADSIISCDTVVHSTNQIELCLPLATAITEMIVQSTSKDLTQSGIDGCAISFD